jgi:glycosyltransferase involved in cell wall biosynthesis
MTGAGSPPLVSIGCAVYNGEATLRRALAPLLAQDYPAIEIVISDDGSTDGSPDIIADMTAGDPRVRLLPRTGNVGLTANFNRVFRAARGKYFLWADQDDIRDPSFVRKAVAALEADPGAVVCQSYTGAFIGDPADIKYIATLDPVAGVRPLLSRYALFLAHYSDLVIYGLIRSDALRRTRLWLDSLGSANALAFELLTAGHFIQVPEVLHFYSGRGVRNRPSPADEYARMNLGRRMPWYYVPFIALAWNQTTGILGSAAPAALKPPLLALLWMHVATVAATKLVYRACDRLTGGRLPAGVTALCERIAEPKPRLVFLNDAARDHELFPVAFGLRGGARRG